MMQLDATGRPDESLAVEVVGPLQSIAEDSIIGTRLSFSLLKGQLRANACYEPFQSVNLEVLAVLLCSGYDDNYIVFITVIISEEINYVYTLHITKGTSKKCTFETRKAH